MRSLMCGADHKSLLHSNCLRRLQNAGVVSPQDPIEDVSLETFQKVVNVNLIGTFLCTREAVRIFKSQRPQGGTVPTSLSVIPSSPSALPFASKAASSTTVRSPHTPPARTRPPIRPPSMLSWA